MSADCSQPAERCWQEFDDFVMVEAPTPSWQDYEDFVVIRLVESEEEPSGADGCTVLEASTDSGYAEKSKSTSEVCRRAEQCCRLLAAPQLRLISQSLSNK